ncbi:acetyl-CoA carboxylase biotin carboxyl carrier protein [Bacillus lacus]|uniref:Biotin carboxyl carrier protein of acetyl-CoA carboxylase n=1 Tax=Metabacillus lacus TaxID=1983721 RepID=A0A7X2J0T4_9BACI|nr:acetyl-CoA carboxylase biotin carboxyl carrier protein [Metabacillus lacus]MRX73169.1 acetyl-CoA carboxylase biotin carboxyl carrier protein [Metabacillus lacus]
MLKIQEIRELIKLIDTSSIDEFTYEHEGSKIKMKKNAVLEGQEVIQSVPSAPAVQPAQQPAPAAAAPEAVEAPKAEQKETKDSQSAGAGSFVKITSPMVGTFYSASSPDAEAFVKNGSKVSKDSVVCIVEAMKLFNEIEAEVNGEVVEILVENGQLVEYGQPLFLVKPE